MNGTLRYAIARTCGSDYSRWETALRQAVTGMRRRKSDSTGFSPHHLMFGIDHSYLDNFGIENQPSVKERIIELNSLVAMRHGQLRTSKSSSTIPIFEINDLILVLDYRLRKRNIHAKTAFRYKGPYKVIEIKPHNLYNVVDEMDMG
ncbi:hypothetical protein AYI69_g6645 [Smittium culicis]|uniref:Retrovirus-related Pol polyprotein from transposon n=1 Tax=Smittium culicis TaxID=133412 RepID=A0A1R1XXG5_9FUNG|nr:hypothetical protein AYI69_g6645 [Smittium culicis]